VTRLPDLPLICRHSRLWRSIAEPTGAADAGVLHFHTSRVLSGAAGLSVVCYRESQVFVTTGRRAGSRRAWDDLEHFNGGCRCKV